MNFVCLQYILKAGMTAGIAFQSFLQTNLTQRPFGSYAADWNGLDTFGLNAALMLKEVFVLLLRIILNGAIILHLFVAIHINTFCAMSHQQPCFSVSHLALSLDWLST